MTVRERIRKWWDSLEVDLGFKNETDDHNCDGETCHCEYCECRKCLY